jgi:hypothetical protein
MIPVGLWNGPARAPAPPARPASAPPGADAPPGDRIVAMPPADDLRRLGGVRLVTSPSAAAAIAAGDEQVLTVDGRALRYPSQDLTRIESLRPDQPGQTHALERHVGTSLADNVARLAAHPLLHAAGSYASLADAQFATDRTIANPANQDAIGVFLADPGRLKMALARVDLGHTVGASTLRADLDRGAPRLIPGRTATVVLIKDPSFPEGYRILTTYPDTGRPEVGARGNTL